METTHGGWDVAGPNLCATSGPNEVRPTPRRGGFYATCADEPCGWCGGNTEHPPLHSFYRRCLACGHVQPSLQSTRELSSERRTSLVEVLALESVEPAATRCRSCGGAKVQRHYWVDPNTLEVFEPVGADGTEPTSRHREANLLHALNGRTWCSDCEEHVELVGSVFDERVLLIGDSRCSPASVFASEPECLSDPRERGIVLANVAAGHYGMDRAAGRDALWALKLAWLADPIWKIEETEGLDPLDRETLLGWLLAWRSVTADITQWGPQPPRACQPWIDAGWPGGAS